LKGHPQMAEMTNTDVVRDILHVDRFVVDRRQHDSFVEFFDLLTNLGFAARCENGFSPIFNRQYIAWRWKALCSTYMDDDDETLIMGEVLDFLVEKAIGARWPESATQFYPNKFQASLCELVKRFVHESNCSEKADGLPIDPPIHFGAAWRGWGDFFGIAGAK